MKIPVIIDTDPGVDDTVAMLLALASPEIEILGYVISFGNTDLKSAYANVFKFYEAVSRHVERYPEDRQRFPNLTPSSKPFIVRGAAGPLEGDLHSAQYFHGRDGLGDITQRHPDLNVYGAEDLYLRPSTKTAIEETLELIRTRPTRSITYLALGPLTNLAQLMRVDGITVRERLGRVICMGGALEVPGNTSPVAEFNFFADPYAVRELLTPEDPTLGLPLERFLLLPLDITTPHELSFPLYKKHVDPTFESSKIPSKPEDKPPLHHFTSSVLERTREIMLQFGKDALELHDIVALWCAIENPPVTVETSGGIAILQTGWTAVKRKFEVERIGELTRGMLVVDRRDDESAYAPGQNRAHVQEELERLKVAHGNFESLAVPAQVEVENLDRATNQAGVACVTQTPGTDVLMRILVRRVWGVEIP